jgi:mannose-1-phosphate guanylyltransferase/mannose-6-phosphate isomerase
VWGKTWDGFTWYGLEQLSTSTGSTALSNLAVGHTLNRMIVGWFEAGTSIVIDYFEPAADTWGSGTSTLQSGLNTTALVKDLVIIETADAVLVADRKSSQDVKEIVNLLSQQQREEKNLHRKVARPWGWYDSVDEGERFKVKRIQVKPGASLSLQMHHHRAEHWIVVKGTAEITNGDQVILLAENQSTYIPQGQTHRLANPGKTPLEIIEVQSGSYLGEDDIVRFEDTYGRS